MTKDKNWVLTRRGTIKTTSLRNARKALGVLSISAGYPTGDSEPHVLYKTGIFSQIRYEVLRYIRQEILGECNFSPTYAALEDTLIVIANERKECST